MYCTYCTIPDNVPYSVRSTRVYIYLNQIQYTHFIYIYINKSIHNNSCQFFDRRPKMSKASNSAKSRTRLKPTILFCTPVVCTVCHAQRQQQNTTALLQFWDHVAPIIPPDFFFSQDSNSHKMPPRDHYSCIQTDTLQERAAVELEAMRCRGKASNLHRLPPACLRLVKSIPGNHKCIDCGSSHPEWATITFGALLCIECSGRHRGFGVQVRCTNPSSVKSRQF